MSSIPPDAITVAVTGTLGLITGIVMKYVGDGRKEAISPADEITAKGDHLAYVLGVAQDAAAEAAQAKHRADAAEVRAAELGRRVTGLERALAQEREDRKAAETQWRRYVGYLLGLIRKHAPDVTVDPLPDSLAPREI